jgi:hypothetical protein
VKLAAAAAVSVVLSGCGGASGPTQQDLAFACQVSSCTCVTAESGWMRKKETAPVLYRIDGAAYCAAGFNLERADSGRRSLF